MNENPYESPEAQNDPASSPPRRTKNAAGAMALLLFSIPAALIACANLCSATTSIVPRRGQGYNFAPEFLGITIGVLGGAVVLGLMIWMAVSLLRGKKENDQH